MDWKTLTQTADKALNKGLFVIGSTQVTLATILTALLVLAIALVVSRWAQKGVERVLKGRGIDRVGTIQTTRRLVHYFILVGGLVASLQVFGIDLSTLFAAGAMFAVGLGIAMQAMAQNLVAGVTLLVERTIRAGDVIEVDGRMVRVERMGIRATVARTRNEEQLIIPNSTLVQTTVKNLTMNDKKYLLRTTVGVVYGADMKVVREVLEQVVASLTWRDTKQEHRVLMTEFGDSSVNFDVLVPMTDPWEARRRSSQLNEAIWWAFKAASITIAFPQLDVHFDPPVEESLRLVAAGSAA